MIIQHNKIDFETLKIRKYNLKELTKAKEKTVNAIDTETLFGYAKVICDNTRHYKLIENIDDVLKALTNKRYRYSHNFFYNIRFDFQALFKYLPDKYLKELYYDTKTEFQGYKIKYIPKKLFRIIRSKHSYVFYDLFNFYETSLENAASTYLNKPKNVENIDRARLNLDPQYWKDNLTDIITYCINDAYLTAELGDFLQREFKTKIGFIPRKYISKASVTKQYFRLLCDIPSIRDVPRPVLSYAFNAYHGGRFEVLQKGYFPDVTLLDIHSAYPYHISNLIDISKDSWYKVSDIDEDATYGFYIAKVSVPYMSFTPLAYNTSFGTCIFPVGDFTTFLTKEEIMAYRDYCDIKIISGYEITVKDPRTPFSKAMHDLYTWKQSTPKEDFRYELVKTIMNALYGCFYEKEQHDKSYTTGQLFNPVYASIITANTRVQLFNTAMKYPTNTLAFATDSVLLQGSHYIEDDNSMGSWGIDRSGKGVVLRSGIYKIGNEIKARGMRRSTNLITPYGKFNNIFDYITHIPDMTRYKILTYRPVNLSEAILHHKKLSLKDINTWRTFPYVININKDFKRGYYNSFERGGDLFEINIASDPIFLKDLDRRTSSQYAKQRMYTAKHRVASEQKYSEMALEIDSHVKIKRERDIEMLNEMRSTITQEQYYEQMEG